MDKPAKMLLGGTICAAVVAAVGFTNTHRLESKLRNLEVECVEEGKRKKLESGRLTLICDAEWLAVAERDSEALVGIQARLAAVKREVSGFERWLYVLAVGVLGFSGVPWAWYFLLRRIRELRDAIIGK
jgi:hypothetical protein